MSTWLFCIWKKKICLLGRWPAKTWKDCRGTAGKPRPIYCIEQHYTWNSTKKLTWNKWSSLTGRSTLTSVPSNKETRQVMTDFASPAAGMCVTARWASLNLAFSACFRMERRPSVLRRKLSIMDKRGGQSTIAMRKERLKREMSSEF